MNKVEAKVNAHLTKKQEAVIKLACAMRPGTD